jgi:hypothetical protein
MADSSARKTAATAAGIVSSVGLVGLVEQYGLGGVLYALSLQAIEFTMNLGSLFLAPLRAFRDGVAAIIEASLPDEILRASVSYSAYSLTQGEWAIFGPLTFPVGVVVTMAGVWLFLEMLRRVDLNPLTTLFDRYRR